MNAVALAINASDAIVGNIVSPNPTAFLYSGGRSYDLNALLPENSRWQIVGAAGINDAGQIVGVGYFSGEGVTRGPVCTRAGSINLDR